MSTAVVWFRIGGIKCVWYKETHDYSHYRPELPSSNMSHATELSADEYIGP
jgi:hypothetical protein